MRLSISNIAWDPSEDEAISILLRKLGVDAIDIAPSKYFMDQATASLQEIAALRSIWLNRGFAIVGMQSLLFGLQDLNIFSTSDHRAALLKHLTHTCRIASGLGATRLVFGSPRNRDCRGVEPHEARALAYDFFTCLGNIASREGVTICLEANPSSYGCNFITTTTEAIAMIKTLNHPAIKLQLDTGTVLINGEDGRELVSTLVKQPSLIGHIHISEPNLLPVGDTASGLAELLAAIRGAFSGALATIEMLATTDEAHISSIDRAIRWVQSRIHISEAI
jgi:D-psicose/D-tagatose/L-ribulose 3-epimerase